VLIRIPRWAAAKDIFEKEPYHRAYDAKKNLSETSVIIELKLLKY
jgi:uncharacterized protein (DUF1330 family)